LFIAALGVILALGFAAYRLFLNPVYTQNLDHVKIVHLNGKAQKLHFEKFTNQEEVFSLEIEVSGHTNENFSLTIADKNGPQYNASIKGGKKVNFTYVQDWYEDEMELTVIPKPSDKGKLEIRCRFISF